MSDYSLRKGSLIIARLSPVLPGIVAGLLAITGLSSPVHANETDSQVWAQLTFNAKYKSGLRLFGEVQPRIGENFSRMSQLLLRPAIGYQVNRKMSVWLGYGYTPSYLPDFNTEHRIFQQLLFEDRAAGLDVWNRTRLEERSIEGAGGTAYRLRHQLRLSKPLDGKRRWAAVLYNELFWNLNSTPSGPQSGFDQHRLHLGPTYNFDRHTRLEVCYMASFVNPPRRRPDRRLDVLMMTLNYNL